MGSFYGFDEGTGACGRQGLSVVFRVSRGLNINPAKRHAPSELCKA